ncbi:SPFH domain-containing protein [Natrarchaeobius chitinivorans]|uniref:SPFH/Band 7/PHB domain protein n=1 Tax=Natrarchaeobius chitinivorans TaxID=1679083 RepID=A0A3N6M6W3_NATCH|nr:SPFH domain-containing protein [Natrarchaeobius chitinivorans]RQG97957.1 SPFH/Band 7/PHB domain protein [Natrarchaeobius chitinivorans]
MVPGAGLVITTVIGVVVGVLVLLVVLAVLWSSVVIVDAYEKKALTVLGEYRKLLEPGINFVPPFVSRTYSYDMRTQTLDVPRQEAITRDNSPVTADAVVYIKVMDAKRAFLEVDNYKRAVSNLAQTTLRAVIGDMELDDTLNKRQEINTRIRRELEGPTDEWGIRVESVEVREVNPTREVTQAMEKQTSAERRRRAMILEAQGKRRSAVEKAEGDKQSEIIRAQGEKQSQILEAQGDAISTVLRARSAESMGERAVIDKGMDALTEIGQSESTTFVMPQELTSMVGRYGKHLSGSDVKEDGDQLESLEFDEETRELIGLDDIAEIVGELEDAEMGTDAIDGEVRAVETDGSGVVESDENLDDAATNA